MFTGLVQGIGWVRAVAPQGAGLCYRVLLPAALQGRIAIGASIAIDGICQTVLVTDQKWVCFEAVPETLARTTLGQLVQGRRVNIEEAVTVGMALGGHMLSGHGYGVGIWEPHDAGAVRIRIPPEWQRHVTEKGYIGVDGVSLTVGVVDAEGFWVHLIAHTLSETILGDKVQGDPVNLEFEGRQHAW